MMPEQDGELTDKSVTLLRESERLQSSLSHEAREAISSHLRWVNCYYSNLIEGSDTHPSSIEAAMRAEYEEDSANRDRQIEAKAHIEVERELRGKVAASLHAGSGLDWITKPQHIRWLHYKFYRHLPLKMRQVRSREDDRTIEVHPGIQRDGHVVVGTHIPPDHDCLDHFLDRFHEAYNPSRHDQVSKVIAAAASHHRLAWIHPFYDGNGRVARLFTQAYLMAAEIDAQGLWSICRGLARSQDTYKKGLREADQEKWNDYDGRGRMSMKALTRWCHFFIDTCIDQVQYMNSILQLNSFTPRLREYVAGLITTGRLPKGSNHVIERAVIDGSITREDALSILPGKERTARRHLSVIIESGLLHPKKPSHRSDLRIHVTTEHCDALLPQLYPPQASIHPTRSASGAGYNKYITSLRLLTQEELIAHLEGVIEPMTRDLIDDSRICSAIAETHAHGYGVDDYEITDIDLFDDNRCTVVARISYTGDHHPEKGFRGDTIEAVSRITIRDKDDMDADIERVSIVGQESPDDRDPFESHLNTSFLDGSFLDEPPVQQ